VSDIDVRLGERVRLSDGVDLVTDIYRPAGSGPFPAVLMRQPYELRSLQHVWLGRCLAQQGFGFVIQAVRGTSDSGGTFGSLSQEPADTGPVLDWLAGRDWFSGVLCPLGVSYSSFAGWLAAAEALERGMRVPCLINLVGALTLTHRRNGALLLHWALPWAIITGRRGVGGKALQRRLKREPGLFECLDLRGIEFESPVARDIWQRLFLDDAPLPRLDPALVAGVPSLSLTGWYDLVLEEAFHTYATLADGGNPGGHVLVCGPWDHQDLPTVIAAEMAGRTGPVPGGDRAPFTSTAGLLIDWLRAHVSVGRPPLSPGVHYFIRTAAEDGGQWGHTGRWGDEPNTELYLTGGSGRRRHLSPQPPADGRVEFEHDPLSPVPTLGGNIWPLPGRFEPGPADQSPLADRPDVLWYSTDPLDEDVVVVGDVALRVSLETDRAPADLAAKLIDLTPDGRAVIVRDSIRRLKGASRRQSLELTLGPVAYRFARGHAIGLELAGSNFPKYDRAVALVDGSPVRVRYVVREGGADPSRLSLPRSWLKPQPTVIKEGCP